MGIESKYTVVVSTFGDPKWQILAKERAIPSAEALGVSVIYNHKKTLHKARNAGLFKVQTEFVTHLDADDELEPGFFEEIEKVKGDVIAPSIRYITPGNIHPPKMPKVVGHYHNCVGDCLRVGNWIIVGAVARTELLHRIGGWRDYSNLEDYDLWQRCWLAGASIAAAPNAIYKAHYDRASGRNTSMAADEYRKIHYTISKTNMPSEDWSWLLQGCSHGH